GVARLTVQKRQFSCQKGPENVMSELHIRADNLPLKTAGRGPFHPIISTKNCHFVAKMCFLASPFTLAQKMSAAVAELKNLFNQNFHYVYGENQFQTERRPGSC